MEEQACHSRTTERRQKLEMNKQNVKQFAGRPDESIVLSPLFRVACVHNHSYTVCSTRWVFFPVMVAG